ncbi:hypothetical protein RGT17_00105 [Bacillus altitudinis]|nr:hypothetical protein [Bacillus pumilus]MDM5319701.1 hypothetical protein [Bacillus pumilus]MDR4993658.1 hypothetical protein [Bacillus altitudinis]
MVENKNGRMISKDYDFPSICLRWKECGGFHFIYAKGVVYSFF